MPDRAAAAASPAAVADPDGGAELPAGRVHAGRPGVPQDAIFEAVLQLLVEVGYEAMTVDALAQRAHVSKATIYKRWEGMPRLVVAALQAPAASAVLEPDEGGLRADLLAFARRFNDSNDRTGALLAALAHAMQGDRQLAAVVATGIGGPVREVLLAIVRRAVDRGELAPAVLSADLVYDVLPLMIIAQVLFNGRRYPDAGVVQIVDCVVLPSLREAAERPADPATSRPGRSGIEPESQQTLPESGSTEPQHTEPQHTEQGRR